MISENKIINIMLKYLTDEQQEKISDELLLLDKRGLDEILQQGRELDGTLCRNGKPIDECDC